MKMKNIYNEDMLSFFLKKYGLNEIFDNNIIKDIKMFQYDKGEIICRSGERLEYMFFLVKGKLKIYTTLPNGKSILLRFNRPLGIIGDMEFLNGYEIKSNVESVNDSILLGISYKALFTYAYDEPKFLRFLVKYLSHKLYTISNAASLNLLYTVESRFASYLISTALDENNSLYIDEIKTSKLTEIAELLGTSYRHLNRVVSKFAMEGIVSRKKGSIIIKEVKRLKELSNGNLYE